MDSVSIVKLDRLKLHDCIREGLSLIGEELPNTELPVLIKPNVCSQEDPSGGANTQMEFVEAVIELMLDVNSKSKIRVVEADSQGKWIDKAFNRFGYREMEEAFQARGYDVKLLNLSKEAKTSVDLKIKLGEVDFPEILLQPKFFISLARAKTHTLTDITGVLKNQFGCIPLKGKSVFHRDIDRVIPEVNRIIQPDLCIVDAGVGMDGVLSGDLKDIGVLICGKAPASTDAVLARVMGFNPEEIPHIALSSKTGLGSLNPTSTGLPIEAVSVSFREPKKLYKLAARHMPSNVYPVADGLYRRFKS